MIFLGDFVYPFETKQDIYEFSAEFINESKFLNLEGSIIDPNRHKIATKGAPLHSSIYAYGILESLNIKAVGLANNHIFDYQIDIEEHKKELRANNILTCGAGKNIEEATKVTLIEDDEYKYAVLAFGWNVIGCHYAESERSGVAPLVEEIIVDSIYKAKHKYPDRKIIAYLHWNYEFEYYPQPADRKLAFSAIEAGADAIIGHHPHIVGVYENYKNIPIFYSLGNFFMPSDIGFGERAQIGLGVKYDKNINNIVLYWIENISDKLSLSLQENLIHITKLEDITHVHQNNLLNYAKWFKMNRRKKKLLPIYYKHDQSIGNKIMYEFLKLRNNIVHKLTVSGLRKRNN